MREALAHEPADALSSSVRDGEGDTIFGIDVPAERILDEFCEEWGESPSFVLMAEGCDPAGRQHGSGDPEFRLIVDPIDGSRGLMHDKRSAWSLAAVATEHGPETRMEHIVTACMTELPTTKQCRFDRIWVDGAGNPKGHRTDLHSGEVRPLHLAPSQEGTLHNGFATVCDYFPGGKDVIGAVAEHVLLGEMGGWDPDKAHVFSDQYISSGGQIAEMMLGKDRFVMDIRPLVYRALDAASSLCARPYDLCILPIAERLGIVIASPDGSPCNPPLDITTNVAFAAYANPHLARRLQPLVLAALQDNNLLEP